MTTVFLLSMILEIFLAITASILVRAFIHKHEKIHGVYSQPGPFYWIKWIIFYVLYRWRANQVPQNNQKYDHGSDLRYLEDKNGKTGEFEADLGTGVRRKMPSNVMERTQHVADSKFAIDAVYFNGFEENNQTVKDGVTLVLGYTQRFRNFAEILFMINVPGVGFLQHPKHPDRIICDAQSNDYQYHGQGITIEMLEPMRKWRIKYNGLMRLMNINDRQVAKKSDTLLHVKFSFIWRSYSDYLDFDTDISASCMAHAFACEEWSREYFDRVLRLHANQSHYEQWGQLQGVLQIENEEPKELLLRGLRDHSFSRRDWRHLYRYLICIIRLDDGTSINASAICLDATTTRLTMGYVIHPNHSRDEITSVNLNLWEVGEDGRIPKEVVYNFVAGGKKYYVVCQIRIIPEFYNGFEWEGKVIETLADYYVNGTPGRGIAEFCYRHDRDFRSIEDCEKSEMNVLKQPDMKVAELAEIKVLDLNDDLCQLESLVGGKGSQVATLTNWSGESDKFVVPSGFCITVNSYKRHIEENEELKTLLECLNSNISSYPKEKLKEACEKIIEKFEKSDISELLSKVIQDKYLALSEHVQDHMVAVRSSAIGEDSIDLSAAGQLETFLGVSGVKDVLFYIKKCWACQYCYSAVEYRRQHGQPTLSTMGVLVQCVAKNTKISGVLFTQHPVTGHPMHSVINCNYGLGETVVSGSAEPDTVVVHCSHNNNPNIILKEIGSKKIKLTECGNGVIGECDVEESDSGVLCVKEDEIFRLVEIGQILQFNSGSARDIEWAISTDGVISLLQSRPITGDPTETDFEIEHEFDSALSNNNYVFTTANIGEMMPGPLTPLTSSLFGRSIEYGMQSFYENIVPRGPFLSNDVFLAISRGHLFLNYTEMLRTSEHLVATSRKDSLDMNLFGTTCTKVSFSEAERYHGTSNIFNRFLHAFRMYWSIYTAEKKFDCIVDRCKDLQLDGKTAKYLYKSISDHLADEYAEAWSTYLGYASASGVSGTILMMILSEGKNEWKTEHYSDVAMIYSNCEGLKSMDAPSLIRETAKHLSSYSEKEKFLSMCPKDAIEWLLNHQGPAATTFKKFLESAGHRCIKEAEMREKSWASDPEKLVDALKAAVKNYVTEPSKEKITTEEAIARLKTPLSFIARNILRFVIPKARKAVIGREYGKSNVIKVTDIFKRAYWKLAGLMEREGYLPEADLIYFLTHGEIGRLLRTRSAHLIRRAHKRRKFYAEAKNLIFDEFQLSMPAQPSNTELVDDYSNIDLMVKGFPVSHGTIKGKARIVLNLKDAHEIQKGDILIVRTTDIGWSPYFPLISGLVTEIGSLISHGATVAREYGLPCIVGAKRATSLFKSGDLVALDGGRGFIRRLEQ